MTINPTHDIPVLTCSPAPIIEAVCEQDRRILLFGPPGIGKSTLALQLAGVLGTAGRDCWCISADPGLPGFGAPGAIALGKWEANDWGIKEYVALCTLDAGRFRLPLVSAVQRLALFASNALLLIDGPGVVRGIAGRELLMGIVEAANVDAVLALTAADRKPPLLDELRALKLDVFLVQAAAEAKRPGKRMRARQRTAKWDTYLSASVEQRIDLRRINLIGTPPPITETSAWMGRQVGLLRSNRTLTMGEVKQWDGELMTAVLPEHVGGADTVLIRDAIRNVDDLIETAVPFLSEPMKYYPPADVLPGIDQNGGPRVVGRVGQVDVSLPNGVFGDPQLHLRLRHLGRSLLFDLGDGVRLPARLAHQVTDVFISHAHMDHISGFHWLLRSRLSDLPICRVYGPPGLVKHIEGFIQCYLWDRIGDRGPVFQIAELHGNYLRRYRIQPGGPPFEHIDDLPVANGVVHEEVGFRVRAKALDHHTPVLAYAFEPAKELNVRKQRLTDRGLEPGPWLASLKQQLLAGQRDALIELPNGRTTPAGTLGDDLVLIRPGKKLVYATDLADTDENRKQLCKLAHNAHTFFCEAPFVEADSKQARRTGHLTARACGEIATAAGVARLVPFHFSRRYADNPHELYEEISAVCTCVVVPTCPQIFKPTTSKNAPILGLDE